MKEIETDKRLADEHSASVKINDVKPYIMKTPRQKPAKNLSDLLDDSELNSLPQDLMSPRQRLIEVSLCSTFS